jgi:AraC family transcriptional regulator
MTAEIIHATHDGQTEYRFHAPVHLLAVYEEASRDDGESFVEGLPRSTLHNMTRKLTFVPAGHDYYERHEPRSHARLMYFYLDPTKLDIYSELGVGDVSLTPRLFFEDTALWESSLKLKRAIENLAPENRLYFEAIGAVLMHELVRLECGSRASSFQMKGGLGLRQQRIITAYIEEHLSEKISLGVLAGLAQLSPHHFCRAFKQSLGMPPHRYHMNRRIERAKTMLAERSLSVTEIALSLGFSETSSLSSAFRKSTGLTPSGYQRSLG